MFVITQNIYFFFDDSGVFHENEKSGYFVYGGYCFAERKDLDDAKRKYIGANKKIKKALNISGELKAANLQNKHKRSLFEVVKEYDSVSCVVALNKIYPSILKNKKAICRYKDYAIKRCVKAKLEQLISAGRISTDNDVNLLINIDQQLTATNGYYDLRDSIREELQHGIRNFDYGVFHKPLFNSEVKVEIKYCESKDNYLIQASDILANRIWNGHKVNNENLLNIPNHLNINLP